MSCIGDWTSVRFGAIDVGFIRAYLSFEQSFNRHEAIILAQENVTLSDRAARRIVEILGGEPDRTALRVSVNGGGCSGFQYGFDLENAANPDDMVIEKGGAKVLIDSVSLMYMAGSEIDFVDDLIGASFQVRNPNAVASCGCGVSFTI